MPGGRLTHQDRVQIAAALSEGLGYAEIARTLGRPTSTVSREVARNGGPDAYQPDHAHHATGVRASRRPGLSPGPPPGIDAYGRDLGAVRAMEERFVAMMAETGFPTMMARVLVGLFLTDSGTLTAAELATRLQVSPASISKAVQHLEHLTMLRRERDPRTRRERYTVD